MYWKKLARRVAAAGALATLAIFTLTPAGARVAPGTVHEKRTAPQLPALSAPSGRVVFDLSHNEIFSPLNKTDLDYSEFYSMFKASGADVSVNRKAPNPMLLSGVKTYVIAGPSTEFNHREMGALHSFVSEGGNLLVLLHISSPVARLTESFGIVVSNFVICDTENVIEGRSQDFYVTRLARHPLTRGVKKVAVFGTWGLMAQNNATLLGTTSEKAWADINRNRKYDKGEPIAKFGIIASAKLGGGKVIVVADDAPFANRFLKEGDNRRFVQNVIDWLGE